MPETTDKKQDTRFKPGQSGNPAGRPKGSRNKISEKLLEALAIDFDAHGKDVIEKVRADRPADYLKIVASLVPKQMEIEDLRSSRKAEDLSDDELAAIALQSNEGSTARDKPDDVGGSLSAEAGTGGRRLFQNRLAQAL
jgi:hypothetical protein